MHLVSLTAIRAGSDQYAAEHGTRGATTLLKSHVRIEGDTISLSFKGKGGKAIAKQVRDAALAQALTRLRELPGRRLFKYRNGKGSIHAIRAGDVNAFLKEIGRRPISLKDFRTLTASMGVLDQLGRLDTRDQRARPPPAGQGGHRAAGRGARQHAHRLPHLLCARHRHHRLRGGAARRGKPGAVGGGPRGLAVGTAARGRARDRRRGRPACPHRAESGGGAGTHRPCGRSSLMTEGKAMQTASHGKTDHAQTEIYRIQGSEADWHVAVNEQLGMGYASKEAAFEAAVAAASNAIRDGHEVVIVVPGAARLARACSGRRIPAVLDWGSLT